MKYNEVFKGGVPEWLYVLKEKDRLKYDFYISPAGKIIVKELQEKEQPKDNRDGEISEIDEILLFFISIFILSIIAFSISELMDIFG